MRLLKVLDLGNNQIGDAGMIEFSRQIAIGSLGALESLGLSGNQIGNEGMKAFVSAIAIGSMANLIELSPLATTRSAIRG